jgi:hypothetical protein
VLISVPLFVVFRLIEANAGFLTIIIGVLIFAVPVALAIAFIHKWIIEARLKNLNKEKSKNISIEISDIVNINKFGDEIVNKFARFVGFVVLVLLFLIFINYINYYLGGDSFRLLLAVILIYGIYKFVLRRENNNSVNVYDEKNIINKSTFWTSFILGIMVLLIMFFMTAISWFSGFATSGFVFLFSWVGWVLYKKGRKWSLLVGFLIALTLMFISLFITILLFSY